MGRGDDNRLASTFLAANGFFKPANSYSSSMKVRSPFGTMHIDGTLDAQHGRRLFDPAPEMVYSRLVERYMLGRSLNPAP